MFRFVNRLRIRLFVLITLAIVPALAVILFTGMEQRREAAGETRAEALRLVQFAATDQEQVIGGARQLLLTLSRMPQVQSGDASACSALLADLIGDNSDYTDILVVGPDGNARCSGVPISGALNVADRSYFQRALQTHGLASGEYQVGRISGKPVLVLAVPVLDDAGQVQVVVAIGLDLARLNQIASEANLPAGSTLVAFDRSGLVLVRNPEPEKWIGRVAPEAQMIKTILASQSPGVVEAQGPDGIMRLYAFMPLRSAPEAGDIYIGVGLPKSTAYAEADRALVQNLVGLGIAIVLALVAIWSGSEIFILRQVEALVSSVRRLHEGDLSARTRLAHGPDELGQLAYAFDEMAEALELRTAELARSRDFYLTLLDKFPTPVWRSSVEAPRNYFNKAWLEFTGRSVEQEMGDGWTEGIHPKDMERCVSTFLRAFGRREPFEMEYRLRHRDGHYHCILDLGRPFYGLDGEFAGYIGACYDTTERRHMETVLRDSERRLQSVIASNVDGMIVVGQGGQMLFVNPAACELLNSSAEKLTGEQFGWPVVEGQVTEINILLPDCAPGVAEMRAVEIEWEGQPAYLASLRDVTTRKQAEQALLQQTLELQMRNEELDAFAHTVAHDLKNPLGPIIGYAEMLEDHYDDLTPAERQKCVRSIIRCTERVSRITDELLQLAKVRQTDVETEPLDMTYIIAEVQEQLTRLVEENHAEIVLQDVAHWPTAMGYAPWIEGVWVNLLNNAVKYGAAEGVPPHIVVGADKRPDGMVFFWVQDDGPGVSPEEQTRLFKQFTRLDRAHTKGHGLGLSIVRRIVEKLGGQVGVESESKTGGGSKFYFTLPAA